MRLGISVALLISQWLVGWWIGVRPRRLPAATAEGGTKVAVIIPARNEAHAIGTLVRALRSQSFPPSELIVVDDGSTDDTAMCARDAGAELIAGTDPPEGWNGKAWACQQGADATSAPVVVFVDADVTPGPEFLTRVVADVHDGALVSVQPRHSTHGVVEGTAAACNLIAVLGSGLTGVHPPAPRVAFGPCLAMTRATYGAIGGHAAVRDMVPEDLALAHRAHAAGVPLRTYVGGTDLTFRMYPEGFVAMVRGFTRNLAAGIGAISVLRLLAVIWWIIGLGSAYVTVGEGALRGAPAFVTIGALAIAAFTVQWGLILRVAGSFGVVSTLCYPVPVLVFFMVVARSLWARITGRAVTWRGRPVRMGATGSTP